ncbi:hypothetical protein Csa_023865, partial [Cucumis sativus]
SNPSRLHVETLLSSPRSTSTQHRAANGERQTPQTTSMRRTTSTRRTAATRRTTSTVNGFHSERLPRRTFSAR